MAYAVLFTEMSETFTRILWSIVRPGTPNRLTASSMNRVTAANVTGAGISWIRGYFEK